MNYTGNYHPPNWVTTDRVRMETFNDMTAKLDAALAASETARQSGDAALAAQLDQKGNCRLCCTKYIGTGTYGTDSRSSLTFPGKPLVVLISSARGEKHPPFLAVYGMNTVDTGESLWASLQWVNNTITYYHTRYSWAQMNKLDAEYTAIALIAMDEAQRTKDPPLQSEWGIFLRFTKIAG